MNNISWLIYLSDLCENLKIALGLFVFMIFIVIVFSFFKNLPEDYQERKSEEGQKSIKRFKRTFYWSAFLILVTALSMVALPSKNTMLMIAASETVGKAIDSEQGRSLTNALQQAIKDRVK